MRLAVEYINRNYGKDCKVSPMYARIEGWRQWLEGTVKGFHSYYWMTSVNGRRKKVLRNRTNMLLKASEDWASILLNEKTVIAIDDDDSQRFVMGEDQISGVFGGVDFWRNANEAVAMSRWSGTAAIEVYVKNMQIMEAGGSLVSGDNIGMNFLSADQIIPISYDHGGVTEAAFISESQRGGAKCYILTIHTLDEAGNYQIESVLLDENGKKIEAEGYGQIVRTGSPIPWFSLMRKSGVNIFDYSSPFGVSIISGNEDVLRGLDSAFDNYVNDFQLGRKMLIINKNMFDRDTSGNAVPPQEDGVSLFMEGGDGLKDGEFLKEYNPALRVQENSDGVQKMLDLFGLKVGLGTKFYQFEHATIQTATEYSGSRQDLVQNAAKEMICIEKCLKEITRAVLWIGANVLHLAGVDPNALITIIADDSYIIDKQTEREDWRKDVAAGLRQKWEYREHFYGEDEETAKEMCRPTLAELLEAKSYGAVKTEEVRMALFQAEKPEEAALAVADISANQPSLDSLLPDTLA